MTTEVAAVAKAARPERSSIVIGGGAAFTLAQRELVRFLRQRNRVIGALGQPVIFWLLLGLGFRGSFRPTYAENNLPYEQYFFPGVLAMIVLFTAIFATISIIEDRREGFLQGVLIAPVPRAMIVLGKVLGGTMLALLQAWIFLLLSPWAGITPGPLAVMALSLFLILLGIALTSLGVALAWRTDSVQGFHAVMTVFLFPLWFLSGAVFPVDGAPPLLAWLVTLNPLSYGVAAIRRLLYLGATNPPPFPESLPSLGVSLALTGLFAALMFGLATWVAQRR